MLAGTGIHSRVTPYIKEEIWSEFRLNVCNNLPQAILGAGVGCYQSSAHMKAISDGLCHELEAIAVAKGIDLSKDVQVPAMAAWSHLQRAIHVTGSWMPGGTPKLTCSPVR